MEKRFKSIIAILFVVIFVLTTIRVSYSQDKPGTSKKTIVKRDGLAEKLKNDKKLRLTLEKVLTYLLNQNLDVQKALVDYKRSRIALIRYQDKFDYFLSGKATYSQIENSPENPSTFFQGREIIQKEYQVGLGKKFSTGTSMSIGLTGKQQDIRGAGEGLPFDIGIGGKGYESQIAVTISQELLKNTFGIADRLNENIIATSGEMQRKVVKRYLASLLVEALIGYWNVSVAEENLETVQISRDSTVNIRNLIQRKQRLGLSEREELLDWNSKVLQGDNYLSLARKNLYDARRAVIRTLNLEVNTDFEIGKTFQTTPPQVTSEQALKEAFGRRVDLINQKAAIKNAKLEMEIASHNKLPSLKLNLSAGNVDYSEESYPKTLDDRNKQWSVGLEMTCPLGNHSADARAKEAVLKFKKNHLELKRLENEIRDEVDSMVRHCTVLYNVYTQTKKTSDYSRRYYFQVLKKFRQGRYSAVQLKLALDGYIRSRQEALHSLVNFNVSLLKRDMARNMIFERYGIDIERILSRFK